MATTEMLTLAQCLRTDRVSGLTLRQVCAVSPDEPVRDVIRRMAEGRTGCALVIEGEVGSGNGNGKPDAGDGGGGASGGSGSGKLIGIFTERDFVSRVVAAGRSPDGPVREVMTPDPITVGEHDSVQRAVEVMERGGYRHLPVTGPDAGRPLGVLSVKDLVHYLVEYFPSNVYNLPPTPDQTQPAREGA